MTKVKKIVSLFLAVAMIFSAVAVLAACKEKLDNEETRLVIASQELDGVFNPFFSSSGPDNTIIGMTQISMLSADKDGKVAVGNDEPCVVLDYSQDVAAGNVSTTYRFVLKKGLKFSNGSPLTMRDVLFNLYVYLDPSYTGSSTIYSTDIVGLAAYRTQIADRFEGEQEKFDSTYEGYAWDRLETRLAKEISEIYKSYKNGAPTDKQVEEGLQATVDYYQEMIDDAEAAGDTNNPDLEYWKKWLTLVDDYTRAKELFMEELETDYTLSIGTAEDIKFDNDRISLTTDTEAFLYNEGFITWDDKEKVLNYALGENSKNLSREAAIQAVYDSYVKEQTATQGMVQVLLYTGTTATLITEFTAMEKKAYFDSLDDADRVKSIKGVRFANFDKSVTVNGKTYSKVEYAADGSVANDTNEVLEIEIKEIDPKAIWNFGFTVAPMYYYSSQEEINKFDFIEHFGVDFGNINFMNDYVKATDKIGLPVGAGPYKATTANGDSKGVTSATFKQNNVVYFERNEHFMFPVKIKYVNYQVVDTKLMLDSLFNGDIHFAEPACKQENIDMLSARSKSGFAYNYVQTNGYGYIGINAEKVPNLAVRQAIMHAMNTELCVAYYAGYASPIYRPMTLASWAYPENAKSQRGTANEQYYFFDETGATSKALVEGEKYVKNSKGIYQKGDDILEYTFTIAGDSEDHPAYNAMQRAATILNNIGFKITVKKDINALKKLNTGDLTVWAAAWGSGVDPDMYQVYHIDSQAGSTANWGYRAIRRNSNHKYDTELTIVNKLSGIIDEARETLDIDQRTEAYARALDEVMKLAVELPTYQRSDLFAYNTKYIDASTLTPKADLTPFNGPTSRIWEISFVNQK